MTMAAKINRVMSASMLDEEIELNGIGQRFDATYGSQLRKLDLRATKSAGALRIQTGRMKLEKLRT